MYFRGREHEFVNINALNFRAGYVGSRFVIVYNRAIQVEKLRSHFTKHLLSRMEICKTH